MKDNTVNNQCEKNNKEQTGVNQMRALYNFTTLHKTLYNISKT